MIDLFQEGILIRLKSSPKILAGFSGGLDSTVLLHHLCLFPDIAKKLTAVHIHHGLHPDADKWEAHCQKVCQKLGVSFISRKLVLNSTSNIEEVARQGRFDTFSTLLNKDDVLVLGQHQDDQAETLLLQLFRGAGVGGLSAMSHVRAFKKSFVIRPLLDVSRQTILDYALSRELSWIEDDSNQGLHFSRNFLRHQVIPLLKKRWPGVTGNLARTAGICQETSILLDDLALIDYPELLHAGYQLPLDRLSDYSDSRIHNILRFWFRSNSLRLPEQSLFARIIPELIQTRQDASPELHWDGFVLRRYNQTLFLLKPSQIQYNDSVWSDFPQEQKFGDLLLKAIPSGNGLCVPKGTLPVIRFRRGGEKIRWHGQNKSLKKLIQIWKIPTWKREQIPLIYINNKLAAVPEFAISDDFYKESGENVWMIQVDRQST